MKQPRLLVPFLKYRVTTLSFFNMNHVLVVDPNMSKLVHDNAKLPWLCQRLTERIIQHKQYNLRQCHWNIARVNLDPSLPQSLLPYSPFSSWCVRSCAVPPGLVVQTAYRNRGKGMGTVDRPYASVHASINSMTPRKICLEMKCESPKQTRKVTYLLQCGHLKGLLPLCTRRWIVNAPVIANALLHPGKSHMYGSVKVDGYVGAIQFEWF